MAFRFYLAVLLLLTDVASSAFAQQRSQAQAPVQPPAAPAPVTAPDLSSARFGDWTLRCNSNANGKVCEMVQTLQIQNQAGQQAPFALLAVGRLAKGEPLKFIAQLPSNITIAQGIAVETKPDRPMTGAFTRCLPIGCFGEIVISDDIRRRWSGRTEPGTVKFHDGANQLITLPLSFRGFSAAAEAMLKEAP